jgi:hypothetical protein
MNAAECIDELERLLQSSGTPPVGLLTPHPVSTIRRVRTWKQSSDVLVEIEKLIERFRLFGERS